MLLVVQYDCDYLCAIKEPTNILIVQSKALSKVQKNQTYLIILFPMYSIDLQEDWVELMNCIAGYGLGGSVIALYGRVGGGK